MQKITMERDDWEDRYEVEAMTVEALQELLKSLEKDYQQIVQESDKKTQHMKNEKHEVHKRWHQSQKATEVDKIEISNLKRKINEFNKKKSVKTQKYDMLEKENKSLCRKLTEKANEQKRKEKEWLYRIKEFEEIKNERDSLLEEKQKEELKKKRENAKNAQLLLDFIKELGKTQHDVAY